jgi:hypothetical protein
MWSPSNQPLSQIENGELATAYNDDSREAHSDLNIDPIQIRNRPAPVPQRQLGGVFTFRSDRIPSFDSVVIQFPEFLVAIKPSRLLEKQVESALSDVRVGCTECSNREHYNRLAVRDC